MYKVDTLVTLWIKLGKYRCYHHLSQRKKGPFELCFFLYSAIYRLEDYLSAVFIIGLFSSPEDSGAADLWLLNSCTVKNPSEDNFRNAVKKAQELDKHLVVAGCVPQGQPKHQIIKGISVIGVIIININNNSTNNNQEGA